MRNYTASIIVVIVLVSVSFAGNIRSSASNMQFLVTPQRTTLVDNFVFIDPLYGYSITVPIGWHVLPPPSDALYGATVLMNYDPDLVGEDHNEMPAEAVKIQIGVAPKNAKQTLDDWVTKWVNFEVNGEAAREQYWNLSTIKNIEVGKYRGKQFDLISPYNDTITEIDLLISADQIMVIGITFYGTKDFALVMDILETLKPNLSYAFSEEMISIAKTWLIAPAQTLYSTNSVLSPTVGTCPVGTFPGNEAPDTPIQLYMPFSYGETWVVGGAGSFYGNWYHCNSNDDYYATDWNLPGGDDNGKTVLPVADGTISGSKSPTCPITGWGCYVQLDHNSGVRTLYAHLSAVYKTSGTVSHNDRIGAVGSTGYSSGPHLHLRFQRDNGGGYHSYCWNNGNNCPNGEAPQSPQSPKPSPMQTTGGAQTLVDGGSYTSNNGNGDSSCNPTADQVALYVDSDYKGACVVKGIGDYPNPSALGIANDSISSVKVGSNVKLTLCVDDNYYGICETFQGDDPNLSDNSIGNDQASSGKVENRNSGNCGITSIPSGYKQCAEEGGFCSFSGTANVIYGANSCYTTPRSFTNGTDCNNNVFVDPIPGVHKYCYTDGSSGIPSGDWQVKYYQDTNLGSQCNQGSVNGTYVFQDWGNDNPISNCPSDNWSARFSRQVNFPGGTYSFGLGSDDWSKIKLDGNVILDNWPPATNHYSSVNISGGYHTVEVEFADTLGLARIAAWWWGPGFDVPRQSQDQNQWYAEYWGNKDLWWDSIVRINEGVSLNHHWGSGGPGYGLPADKFSSRFSRRVNFECGNYQFTIDSDDGYRFYIDGVKVSDRWQDQDGTFTFSTSLTSGYHDLKLEHYENGGGAKLGISWVKTSSCAPPDRPSNVQASDGTFTDRVRVSWYASASATRYEVYRATSASGNKTLLGSVTNTSFDDMNALAGTVYYYWVKACNDSGCSDYSFADTGYKFVNYKIYLPFIIKQELLPSWTIIKSETFEGSFPNTWSVFDNDGSNNGIYYWGKRNCMAYQGSYSGWAVGDGTNGSGLSCGANYPNYAKSWLKYGPFSLSDAYQAELRYMLWLNSESNFDWVCRMASIDGNTFYGSCSSGYSNGWVEQTLDLSNVSTLGDLRGRPNVWILISFTSDLSINYSYGALVDNVVLRKCTSAGGCAASGSAGASAEPSGLVETPMMLELKR